ncbi:MAG: polysaccharide deacetylase family protein [Lachnospiraceae bacterium]|nr:polysaccharide deacetylase family protein [Lachnospiraceae bacterium]
MIEYYSIFDQEDEQTRASLRGLAIRSSLMGDNKSSADVNERRKRVNRIKRGIVFTVLGTVVFLTVLCVVLCVMLVLQGRKLNLLQRKLDEYINLAGMEDQQIGHMQEDILKLESEISELKERQDNTVIYREPVSTDTAEVPVPVKEYDVKDHISYSDNVRQEGEPCRVYLTFDDGPSSNTLKILNLLDKHGVKGTFFVNGKTDETLLPLYKEITDRGNTIGMHSYSHDYNTVYDSAEGFESDMLKLRGLIVEQTGVDPVFYRFPGGSSNTVSKIGINPCIDVLAKYELVYFDWNVQCGDATSASLSVDTLVDNVMRDVLKYKTSVVLMHDSAGRDKTVKALSIILDRLDGMDDVEILPITEDTDVIHHE